MSAAPLAQGAPDAGVSVVGIQSQNIAGAWGVLGPWVERLVGLDARMRISEVRRRLEAAEMQLFVAWDEASGEILAAMLTEVDQYPARRVFSVQFLAGEQMERWIGYLPALERWARAAGCAEIEVRGRPGWGRVTGYEERCRVFAKDLGGDDDGQ